MDDNQTIEILKQAILLERRGKAFYTSIAKQATDEDVRSFFELMAKEEDEHIHVLTQQSQHYYRHSHFDSGSLLPHYEQIANEVLSEKIRHKISASSFEAAAIQSAIDMETRAVEVYSQRADSATDPEERLFYQWLANWERGHHTLLLKIDQELKEEIWNDNNFWPF